MRRLAMLFDDAQRDVAYAARTLRRAPGFAIVVVVTLALGIGANTAIFSVVNALLLRPLPYKDADRLVRIFGSVPPTDNSTGPARRVPAVQVADIAPLRAQTKTLSHIAFYLPLEVTMTTADEIVKIEGARVSAEGLAMLGAQPVIGRGFESKEESSGADTVAILSYITWQRNFGGAPDVVGRNLTLDGRTYAVIGVMPATFQFPDPATRFWIPFVATDFPMMGGSPIARLKDGVTIEAATAEVTSLLPQVRASRPAPPPMFAAQGPPPAPYFAVRTADEPFAVASSVRRIARELEPQATVDNIATMEQLVSNSLSRPRLYAVLLGLFAAVAVTLTAIGIYGVMAYSVTQRRREIGIRMALGAQQGNVMALVLGQSVMLTAIGIVIGVVGAFAVTRYLAQMLFGVRPLDPATFIVVSLLFASIAALASFVPARRATQVDPLVALRYD